jgi:hypothetical protein
MNVFWRWMSLLVRKGRQAGPLNGLIVLLTVSAALAVEPNRLTPDEVRDGWILLFDGESTFGWRANSDANWQVQNGTIAADAGTKGLLLTTSEFADYVLRVDFKATAETNSGIFLRTPINPTDPAVDCYELNIATPAVSPFPTGSFVNRANGDVPEFSDQWQSYQVTVQGGQFMVELNGVKLLEYTDVSPRLRGHIGLQFNSGPIAFRNVKLKPLGLKPLFNGRDLSGWKNFPGKQSKFDVVDGEISVLDGPGTLESESQFANFVLQMEAKTNGPGLNSGVFFRSIPGEYNNGYESQIQNAVHDNDPAKPVDCGTGGIFRRQNARRVVASDGHWFAKTIIADGPHMAVWVNGFQVSDWTDERAADDNPRKGLRLKPGTLQLQGHDPTTDIRFRALRAIELPARL